MKFEGDEGFSPISTGYLTEENSRLRAGGEAQRQGLDEHIPRTNISQLTCWNSERGEAVRATIRKVMVTWTL